MYNFISYKFKSKKLNLEPKKAIPPKPLNQQNFKINFKILLL